MVRGLDIFKKYFEGFPQSYVIIGGTAKEKGEKIDSYKINKHK